MPLKISRILHAGYMLECENTRVVFDPIFENPFSRNCYAFPEVRFDIEKIKGLSLDAIFISHYHDDHCSLESLNLLNRATPIYIYCLFDKIFSLLKELGFKNVYPLELGIPVQVGAIEVIPRRALDADVDSIFQIRAAGVQVLNVVDSWIDYETLDLLARQGPWDMILWPFQTMRELEVISPSRFESAPTELPPEWIEQLKVLNPKYLIPSSCQFRMETWSWYNHAFFPITYKQFQKEISSALPKTQVVRLDPAASVSLSRSGIEQASPLGWVQPVGDQNVDYDYRPDLIPPKTAEIAKHFEALTKGQTTAIHKYCQQGLVEKFKSLEFSEDNYFEKPRLWKLSLYDHTGQETEFFYHVSHGEMELVTGSTRPLAWATEVSVARVHAALNEGESLTSMYVRINDVVFAPEIEKEIKEADPMEDPLLRALYTGVFGAYQEAQLKRILSSKGARMSQLANINVEHFYNHSPAAVWKCLTTPELHAKWWGAGDVKAEVGHKFTLDMGPFGKQPCEVLAVEPEKKFRFKFAVDTIINWELIKEGTGTRLKLTHEGFDLDSPESRRAYEGMGKGWPRVLERMEPVLKEI